MGTPMFYTAQYLWKKLQKNRLLLRETKSFYIAGLDNVFRDQVAKENAFSTTDWYYLKKVKNPCEGYKKYTFHLNQW